MAKSGLHLTVACGYCAASFRQSRSDQAFCSRACGMRDWRRRNPSRASGAKERSAAAGQTVPCARCETPFKRRGESHRYCGAKCKGAGDPSRSKRFTVKFGAGKGHMKGAGLVDRATCRVCEKSFYASPSLKRRGGGIYCSVDCRARAIATDPSKFPHTAHKRGRGGRREDLAGRYFRSRWEANWARYLKFRQDQGLIARWEYEVDTFEFVGIKRGSRFYTPDFKVHGADGSVWYEEVKGWMDARSATKLRRMAKYHPHVRVELIDKARYSEVAAQVKAIIPHWETAA
jgi:hypothetical protein